MRPTDIGYRSPREKTPAFYNTFVSYQISNLRRSKAHRIFLPFTLMTDKSQEWRLVQPALRIEEAAHWGVCSHTERFWRCRSFPLPQDRGEIGHLPAKSWPSWVRSSWLVPQANRNTVHICDQNAAHFQRRSGQLQVHRVIIGVWPWKAFITRNGAYQKALAS